MRRRVLVGALSGALLLAACGGSSAPTSGDAPSPPASPSSPAPPTDGPSPDQGPSPTGDAQPHEQLAFQAPQLDGSTFDGVVTGDVVVWFWAPW